MAREDDHEGEAEEAMPRAVRLVSAILERVAEANDAEDDQGRSRVASLFDALTRPTISVHSYLRRIFKYAQCSASCFVVAYVYLDRFAHRQRALPISSLNVHRLIITSVMVAAKFMDDLYYNNAYYAKIGGISTSEMNLLELDFLFGVSFQLNVTPSTFHTYCSHLHAQMMLQLDPPPPPPPNKPLYCHTEDDAHQKELLV